MYSFTVCFENSDKPENSVGRSSGAAPSSEKQMLDEPAMLPRRLKSSEDALEESELEDEDEESEDDTEELR